MLPILRDEPLSAAASPELRMQRCRAAFARRRAARASGRAASQSGLEGLAMLLRDGALLAFAPGAPMRTGGWLVVLLWLLAAR